MIRADQSTSSPPGPPELVLSEDDITEISAEEAYEDAPTVIGGRVFSLTDEGDDPSLSMDETYPSSVELREHPMVGNTLGGRYTLLTYIGKGAHSWVFRAEDNENEQQVAIKVLRPELTATERLEEFQERFLREASLMKSMDHASVVRVYEYGLEPSGACYIVMELLQGFDLRQKLREGPLDLKEALPLAVRVCDALAAAHTEGFVHRDIKPSNIFLVKGELTDIRLLDFGLVRSTQHSGSELTDNGGFVGTPQYASPEQVRGDGCDQRSDIYAMGVLLFRMLTGRVPFRGSSWVDVAIMHLETPVPTIASTNSDVLVPYAVESIARRCMAKSPNQRFQSIFELSDALLAALESLDSSRKSLWQNLRAAMRGPLLAP